MRYAQHFHAKKKVTGHLWKGRFLSCILDKNSVFEELRYIENDPVRAGFVQRAEDYAWSSARHHVHGGLDPVLSDNYGIFDEINNWQAYLTERGDAAILERTWRCLKTGRPSGDNQFVHALEETTGRRLIALPRGRPRKKQS